MSQEEKDKEKKRIKDTSANLGALLEERERLESLIRRKFTRVITVMFTDLKGSTSIAESKGDLAVRLLLKKHLDILRPVIDRYKGVLVKTMGDGTMSYFTDAADAIRAAVDIQRGQHSFNSSRMEEEKVHVRVGLNTGTGLVEKDDILGDVVNVASRFEALARAGEILITESSFDSVQNAIEEFRIRFLKMANLKGKSGEFKVFKVFWNPEEVEDGRGDEGSTVQYDQPGEEGGGEQKTLSSKEIETLREAGKLEREQEMIRLFLLCESFSAASPIGEICGKLRKTLKQGAVLEGLFFGEKVLWHYKESIVMGRTPMADVPLSNKALSRVPVSFSIKNGEAMMAVESRGASFKAIELDKPLGRTAVQPDTKYVLGERGKVIFSSCFPIEYELFNSRLLILRIINPEECLRKYYNVALNDVWKDFKAESERVIAIGL